MHGDVALRMLWFLLPNQRVLCYQIGPAACSIFLCLHMAQAVKVISLKNELNLVLLFRVRKDMLFHNKTISGQYSYEAQLTK